jgi:hypothetical protein
MATDFTKEFNKLIDDEGSDILLIRQGLKIRCYCWDEETKSADRKCPTCLGTGFTVKIEKHTVYQMVAAVPETLPRLIRPIEIGKVAIESRNLYFKNNARVNRGDLVAIVGFDSHGRIVHPINLYEVNHVEPYRIKNVVQYSRVSASLDPIDTSIISFNMVNKGYYPVNK